jgi:hypothetical protein
VKRGTLHWYASLAISGITDDPRFLRQHRLRLTRRLEALHLLARGIGPHGLRHLLSAFDVRLEPNPVIAEKGQAQDISDSPAGLSDIPSLVLLADAGFGSTTPYFVCERN